MSRKPHDFPTAPAPPVWKPVIQQRELGSLLLTQIRSAKAGKSLMRQPTVHLFLTITQQAWYPNSSQWFLKLSFFWSGKNHCQAPYSSWMWHWSWAQELPLVLKNRDIQDNLCPSPHLFPDSYFLNFLQDSFISTVIIKQVKTTACSFDSLH